MTRFPAALMAALLCTALLGLPAPGAAQDAPAARSRKAKAPAAAAAAGPEAPAVLQPLQPPAPQPRQERLLPAAADDSHFVVRTRHLLDLARRHPAPPRDPWFKVNGVPFWPASPIARPALKLLADEGGAFDPAARDAALQCRVPQDLPDDTRLLLLDARSHGDLALPVFLSEENGQELHYLELSLDQPGAPVLLWITGYDGLAVRITTSPATRLAAVHLQTYYPSVVLGVDPARVSRQYYRVSSGSDCGTSSTHAAPPRLQGEPLRYQLQGQDSVAIGAPQPVRREPPLLGAFLDPEMPVPGNYGIVVLADQGYLRLVPDGKHGPDSSFEVQKPFRIPAGLAGAHSVRFLVPPGVAVPSGPLAHSSMVRLVTDPAAVRD
jgi:hypothetical protein